MAPSWSLQQGVIKFRPQVSWEETWWPHVLPFMLLFHSQLYFKWDLLCSSHPLHHKRMMHQRRWAKETLLLLSYIVHSVTATQMPASTVCLSQFCVFYNNTWYKGLLEEVQSCFPKWLHYFTHLPAMDKAYGRSSYLTLLQNQSVSWISLHFASFISFEPRPQQLNSIDTHLSLPRFEQ